MGIDSVFSCVAGALGMGSVTARFYPYSELKHTWRVRGGAVEFRVSDYLDGSPPDVQESLAWFLLRKASRVRSDDRRAERYLGYARSKELWHGKRDLYLSRAKSLVLEPKGESRDLGTVFDYVNSVYFAGRFEGPTLAWAEESPAQRLGFYFEPLNLLAANRVLDSERVPRYALEFVVYHELLHCVMTPSPSSGRRIHHTRAFRDVEREFSHFDEAQGWMTRLAAGRPRCSKKGYMH
ncbi:MAG: hypothetical protein A3K67_01905 [Euryarchaeota archaeon RBG_16_62_10]|nr:MAG: hypothetical protein A3K67_01905 [Euryarchaeota archaeon RBG_16_62_10]